MPASARCDGLDGSLDRLVGTYRDLLQILERLHQAILERDRDTLAETCDSIREPLRQIRRLRDDCRDQARDLVDEVPDDTPIPWDVVLDVVPNSRAERIRTARQSLRRLVLEVTSLNESVYRTLNRRIAVQDDLLAALIGRDEGGMYGGPGHSRQNSVSSRSSVLLDHEA